LPINAICTDMHSATSSISFTEDEGPTFPGYFKKNAFWVMQYTGLPFSVKTASTLFEQINDATILGLSDTSAYLDFIIGVEKPQERVIALFNVFRSITSVFEPKNIRSLSLY
uniref:Guanine deaminase n=1 Tax=Hymenolepis diminuta TaxID=6216 RepID=A0A0R3SW88_HYMDI